MARRFTGAIRRGFKCRTCTPFPYDRTSLLAGRVLDRNMGVPIGTGGPTRHGTSTTFRHLITTKEHLLSVVCGGRNLTGGSGTGFRSRVGGLSSG